MTIQAIFPEASRGLLIVDDDVDAAAALEQYLSHQGYQVHLAYNLNEAEQALGEQNIKVVLLDVRLGQEFGLDLIPRVREKFPDVFFVIMTAYAETEVAIEALKRGAHDFLHKPVDVAVLTATLGRVFETSRLMAEREEALRQLARSEANMRMAQEVGKFGSWEVDLLTGASYWSEEHYRMFGVDPQEFTPSTESFIACIYPEDRAALLAAFEKMGNGQVQTDIEYRIVRPDGEVRHMHSAAMVARGGDGTPVRWFGMVQDVTARKAAEAELQHSQERLTGILSLAADAIISIDEGQHIVMFNRGAEQTFGYTAEEIIGRPLAVLMPKRFRIKHHGYVAEFQGDRPDQRYMSARPGVAGLRKNGEEFPAEASISHFISERGKTSTVILRDISARVSAERELTRSEARLRQAVDIARLGTFQWELDTKLVHLSEESCRILGIPSDGHAGYTGALEPLAERVHPDDLPAARQAIEAAIKTGQPYRAEYRAVRPDGAVRNVQSQGELILNDLGRPQYLVGIVHDITERTVMEQQLRQAQKMEAVGALAGGVAHDFNNMLQIVRGYSSLALDRIEQRDKVAEYLGKVLNATENASSLTQQLLAFSRRQMLHKRPVDLNALISRQIGMLGRIIRQDIELALVPSAHAATVKADSGMMEQVILNLALNARDAMPDGGKLTIALDQQKADAEFCRAHSWARPIPYVVVRISDTGFGMEPEVRDRVFDPFFTTKEVGKGTGLGLAMVFGIVQQHDGMISVYSEANLGTTFTLYLPEHAPAESLEEEGHAEEIIGGKETILVAEDEEDVRNLVVTLLQEKGYSVLAAQDGVEALDLFTSKRDSIDLALLDMIMPRKNGRQLYEELVALQPDLRVLFSSGYAGENQDSDFIAERGLPVVRKPYNPSELYRAIREVLSEVSR